MSVNQHLVRVASAFFVSILVFFGSGPVVAEGHDDCSHCSGESLLSCPSCDGKGSLIEDCTRCRGTGDEDCLCQVVSRLLRDTRYCPKCKGRKRDCGTCEQIRSRPLPAKGNFICPNPVCEKGRIKYAHFGVVRNCMFCRSRKGEINCKLCRDGTTECEECRGREKVARPCTDCAATGKLPCPVTSGALADDCLWCRGRGKRSCGGPTGPSRAGHETCRRCSGSGRSICFDCLSFGRNACRECNGTGVIQAVMVDRYTRQVTSQGGKSGCDDCGKKGVLACRRCEKGKANCSDCNGTGRGAGHCDFCQGPGILVCGGCRPNPVASYEKMASFFEERGDIRQAVSLLEKARVELAELTFEELKGWGLSKDEIEETLEGRSAGLARVKDRLVTLRGQAGVAKGSSGSEPESGSESAAGVSSEVSPSATSSAASPSGSSPGRESPPTPQENRGSEPTPTTKKLAVADLPGKWKTLGRSYLTVETLAEGGDWQFQAVLSQISRSDRDLDRNHGDVLVKLKKGEGENPFSQGSWMTEIGRCRPADIETMLRSGDLTDSDPVWRPDEESLLWDRGVLPLTLAEERGPFFEGLLVDSRGREIPIFLVVGAKSLRLRPKSGGVVRDEDRVWDRIP